MTRDELLQAICDVIVDEVHPRKVVLFGSFARGEERSESDVDVMIVADAIPAGGRLQVLGRLYLALGGMPVSKDLLFYTSAEVEKWKGSRNHVIAKAMQEGKVLYDRVVFPQI